MLLWAEMADPQFYEQIVQLYTVDQRTDWDAVTRFFTPSRPPATTEFVPLSRVFFNQLGLILGALLFTITMTGIGTGLATFYPDYEP